jgi:hypothetical protein
MSLKSLLKSAILGRPGLRPRAVRRGLLRGLTFQIDTANKSQRLLGLDEAELTSAVRRFAALAKSAVDVGANDGWYSIFFASQANISRVIAFEPCHELQLRMRQNAALNKSVISDKLEFVERFVGIGDYGAFVALDAATGGLATPVLIKIDVDGGELDVLRSAERVLSTRGALLIIETHTNDLEQACIEFLRLREYETRVVYNAWYRCLIPEGRAIPHNRWLLSWPTSMPV